MTDPASVQTISLDDFRLRLQGSGLGVRLGVFDVKLQSSINEIVEPLHLLYQHYPLLDDHRVFSCHVALQPVRRRLRGRRRKVQFLVDGQSFQEDEPAEHALAVLEWGLNLVIAFRFARFLMLHAAVLERNGKALVMPAAPGDGKTTLCAALAHRGWRLLSDEFGIVRPGSCRLVPMPRPMPIKNESIEVIKRFAADAVLGPAIAGTRKGTVAHVVPPLQSVQNAHHEVPIGWIVFPRWVANASLRLDAAAQMETFRRVATNSFNYELLGAAAFEAVRDIVDRAPGLSLEYSDLSEAVAALTAMADDLGG